MLADRATRVMAIPRSGIHNSLVFRLFSFFRPLIIFRALSVVLTAPVGVLARTSGCACRARVSLRTRWSRRSCHWRSRWSRLAPSDK
jgi:hypothetical protein